jgi:hypothetical protein
MNMLSAGVQRHDPHQWSPRSKTIILTANRSYLVYSLSYRDDEEFLGKREISVTKSSAATTMRAIGSNQVWRRRSGRGLA